MASWLLNACVVSSCLNGSELGAEAGVPDLDAGVRHGGVLLWGAEHREAAGGGGDQGALHPQAQGRWRHRRRHRPPWSSCHAVSNPALYSSIQA